MGLGLPLNESRRSAMIGAIRDKIKGIKERK